MDDRFVNVGVEVILTLLSGVSESATVCVLLLKYLLLTAQMQSFEHRVCVVCVCACACACARARACSLV